MRDDLIARLSADLRPVHRGTMTRMLLLALAAGILIAAVAMYLAHELRADIATAPTTMMFWTKSAYTFALAVFGGIASLALARPDGRITWPWFAALLAVALVLAVGAFIQLAVMPPDLASHLILGGSHLVCPWYIVGLSLPVLAAVMVVMRRFAPANPTLAGLAAGLLSGGTGAWIYSFHCGEDGMMFLLLWYTHGVIVVGVLGALSGRFLLRW